MSLFKICDDQKIKAVAQKVFKRPFELDPGVEQEYDDRRKSLML